MINLTKQSRTSKQNKLIDFYKSKFLNDSIPKTYSSPHLISLNKKNINTDIMIIGQETNSWYGNYDDFNNRGIQEQMKIYDNFMENIYTEKNNIFFRYVKDVINDENCVPVWTNLFKFDLEDARNKDKNISKSSKEEYENIINFHNEILAKEIEIVQPKIIIFFTGQTYDKLFFDPLVIKDKNYRDLYNKISVFDNIDEWKCAVMDLKKYSGFTNFKGKAIRTYHPSYLNKNFGTSIINYIKKEISYIK